MCVLALWVGADLRVPLIAAANRDEVFGRPAAPPAAIDAGIVAGRDLQAGGTWLGVNRHGLFVAVTNRREPARAPDGLSRGLLALEALRRRDLDGVQTAVAALTRERPVAGFNLVAVVGGEGVCLHWDGALRAGALGPGLHVVSNNRDLDDDTMPEKKTLDAFDAALGGLPDEAALQDLLRTHDGERPICKHEERYGTVSSAIYVARHGMPRLLYADGAPCRHGFRDCSAALRALGPPR